jgi:DNA-binding winged helix-turn-helix (wHTH) protein/Tol biopolymer transport system component
MSTPPVYRFADLTLDVGQARLERGGKPIQLGRLTYRLLLALVESAPNVLTHDDLVRRVWAGRATSPETVVQRVKLLRDALQDDAEQPRYIALVRGQGYRLIPPVETARAATAVPQRAVRTSPRRPRMAIAGVSAILASSIAVVGYLWLERGALSTSTPVPPRPLDFEIAQLTSSGRAISPAISPDGRFVAYSLMDEATVPTSLWVRQLGTTRDIQVVAPGGAAVVSAAISPDGSFIDYIKISPPSRELWRVPFLGGTPRRVRSNVSSAVGWSPDGKRAAFVAFDELGNTSLIVREDAGEERVLATRTVPTYFVSTNIVGNPPLHPAWSPDGRLIAVAETTNVLAPRIVLIDALTGEETAIPSQGSFVTQGVGWLGPSTLVLSQPSAFGQRIQLQRMAVSSGAVTPLTNDLSSYLGVELDQSRTRLVTTRREMRAAVYVVDASGGEAVEVVPQTPMGTLPVLLSWTGDRLLYDTTFSGRAAIAALTLDGVRVEEFIPDAFHVAAAPDGSAIVFSSATLGREGLWKTDAAGLDPVQLVSGFAVEPVVTRDRAVVFVSNRSGVQSPWIVPLDGGEASEIVQETAHGFDVAPDGRRLAFLTTRDRTQILVTCDLPLCSDRRELMPPPNFGAFPLRWTPDGRALAYVDATYRAIWAMPVDGGTPYAIATYAPDTSPIAWFAWSGDGQRLGFIRITVEFDVVLLSNLSRGQEG